MSTHSKLDKICVAIVICCLILTGLFIKGESLGITKIVDEDAEQNSDSEYFTTKDQDGDWDTTDATVITLTGDGADISGTGAYTNDGNVVITSAGCYVVSGTLTDGYLCVDAYDSSKVFIQLNGVTINCSDDACIRVDQADKVFLTLAEGSQNTLTSGSTYSDEALNDGTDGAIFAHDDLTINGSGSLTVNAEYRHGIAANDDLIITGGTITVTAAADAIHANDSLRIKDASITVEAGDDGIVTSNEEENGYLYIESGTLNVTAADDGIHTTGDITLAGGEVTVSAGDDGIHSDASVLISDGTLLIEECYEGIEALIIDVSGGDVTIYPQDDGFNANGNSDSQIGAGGMGGPQTGSGGSMDGAQMGTTGQMPTPPEIGSADSTGQMQAPPEMGSADSTGSMPTPPEMGSADSTGSMPTPPEMPEMGTEMESAEGNTGTVTSAGSNPGGTNGENAGSETSNFSAGSEPAVANPGASDSAAANAGTADLAAADSKTSESSSSNNEETYINISGGTITIINETGNDADGLDSNGDVIISGGTIYVSLQGSGSNSAVDYASENGGVAEISGGTIIACGASSMAEAFDSSSTQASILYNTSTVAEAGTTLAIEDTDGNVLLSWNVPCSFSSALVSCPQMETGSTYKVVIGDNEETITLEEMSASYGDAQSSMFGGNMNWGGMQPRGGSPGGSARGDSAFTGSTDTAAAPADGQMPSGTSDTSQSGAMAPANGQMPSDSAFTSSTDTAAAPAGGQAAPDQSRAGMTGGPMQEQQDQNDGPMQEQQDQNGGPMQGQQDQNDSQTQEEEDQAAETVSTAKTVDSETWGILGGCAALLLAAIAVGKFYKRH